MKKTPVKKLSGLSKRPVASTLSKQSAADKLAMLQEAMFPKTSLKNTPLNARVMQINAAGMVYEAPGEIRIHPLEHAFLRLQELHLKSIDRSGPYLTAIAEKLDQQNARLAYGDSLYAALGYLIAVGPDTRLNIFEQLCTFVSRRGFIEGLEALFLTGLRAAQLAARTQKITVSKGPGLWSQGSAIWKSMQPTSVLGGGAGVIPIFDVDSKKLAFRSLRELQDVARGNVNQGSISNGTGDNGLDLGGLFGYDGGGQIGPVNPLDAASEGNGDRIAGWAGAGAAVGCVVVGIIGGALGAPIPAPGTTAAGAWEGCQAGGVVGGGLGAWLAYMAGPPKADNSDKTDDGGAAAAAAAADAAAGAVGGAAAGGQKQSSGPTQPGGQSVPNQTGGEEIQSGGDQPPICTTSDSGMPNPDATGADDGGVRIPTKIPFGSGLTGGLNYLGGGIFTANGWLSMDDEAVSASNNLPAIGGGIKVQIPAKPATDPIPDLLRSFLQNVVNQYTTSNS